MSPLKGLKTSQQYFHFSLNQFISLISPLIRHCGPLSQSALPLMDPTTNSNPEPPHCRTKNPISGPSNRTAFLTKTSSLNPRKSSSLQNLFHLKSLSRSADFDAEREKETRGFGRIKSKEEKEKVKGLPTEEEKKEVYCKLKNSDEASLKEDAIREMKRLSISGARGGRRRSIYVPQNELRDFLVSNGAKVVAVDMPPFMQIHAVDCARRTNDSLEKFSSKSLALTLKKEFDGIYGPAWHCIVGMSFGSFVTHSVGGFMYFTIDQKLYILLFKTTVQRA